MDKLPYYFGLAEIASKYSNHHKKMGAVIYRKGRPISIGFNKIITHPVFANGNKWFSIHAEVNAIIKSRSDVDNAIMYVYRETRNREIALAKPCLHCMKFIIECGIKRLFYTTNSYPFYEINEL